MDAESLASWLPASYVEQATQHAAAYDARVRHLLAQRRIPDVGWSEADVERLLNDLARLDANNFTSARCCGVGEREGRIFCPIVARRHGRMAHGVGRSGDLTAVQPKAAGSSVLNSLANQLVLHYFRHVGIKSAVACLIVPVATGLALTLSLLAIKRQRPEPARYVLWSRIDQKACFKSITCAGLTPVVIEPIVVDSATGKDMMQTDVEAIQAQIDQLGGADAIVCYMSTTSCFAPRSPDLLHAIDSVIKYQVNGPIPHLVNNAYGLQSRKCCHLIDQMFRRNRSRQMQLHGETAKHSLDLVVQSTDKNFGVPVGGAVICADDAEWLRCVAQTYPGRASSVPATDVTATLLHLGLNGIDAKLDEQRLNFDNLRSRLASLAAEHGESLLPSASNKISMAMSLSTVAEGREVTRLGAMLFRRAVTGARVVAARADEVKTIDGHDLTAWGCHSPSVMTGKPYLAVAASIGMRAAEVDIFVARLRSAIADFVKLH